MTNSLITMNADLLEDKQASCKALASRSRVKQVQLRKYEPICWRPVARAFIPFATLLLATCDCWKILPFCTS